MKKFNVQEKKVFSAIAAHDYPLAGKELASDQNGKGVAKSVLFSTIGRELFKQGANIEQLNAFADIAREHAHNKQDLSRNLKDYVCRGYNAESGEGGKMLHFWGEHKKPAVFTHDAEPAKAPKVNTVKGTNQAPTGEGAPDSSNSTPEAQAKVLELTPLSISDVEAAVVKGQISLKELAGLVDRLTAVSLAELVNKTTKGKKAAKDKKAA